MDDGMRGVRALEEKGGTRERAMDVYKVVQRCRIQRHSFIHFTQMPCPIHIQSPIELFEWDIFTKALSFLVESNPLSSKSPVEEEEGAKAQ